MTKYEWDKEVAPGITSIATPGHTPGHTSFVVAVGLGQAAGAVRRDQHSGVFVRHPDWHVVFDNDPAMAQATRHKFYDMAAAEKALVAGYHFSFPSVGHVEKDGHGLSPRSGRVAADDLSRSEYSTISYAGSARHGPSTT